MSLIYSYKNGGGNANESLMFKQGTDKAVFAVDFIDGFASSSLTISAVTCGAVDSSNADATSYCISSATTIGTAIAQVLLLTCGTSGTQTAVDGARFRLRTQVTLSNSEVLQYNTYLQIETPTYGPA